MRVPEHIDSSLLAPCGVNCFACYKHLAAKKPCCGCLAGDEGKPGHCRTCFIKECCEDKGIARCFECAEFPCPESKRMERNYKKYGVSPVGNLARARAVGLDAFMREERERWSCTSCGRGAVSQHRGVCSECGHAVGSR